MTAGQNEIAVIFVGSFVRPDNGRIEGGQMYACSTLVEAPFSIPVKWIKIDSTASTNRHRSFAERAGGAVRRLLLFSKNMISRERRISLIFIADGFGFIEKGLMVLLAASLRRPVVLAPRSGKIIDDVRRSRFMAWFVAFVARASSRIVCQGSQWAEFYGKLLDGDVGKIVVIHNWVDAGRYADPVKGTQRDSNAGVVIVFIGWIERNKGIFELLQAMSKLRDLDVRLIVGGQGADDEKFDEKIRELGLAGCVERAGWVSGDSKLQLLEAADIFVLPSYREGMPNALLEAMAAGLPCVATSVGSIPDVITNGETGLLVEPGDADELSRSLRRLIEDRSLRSELGVKAQCRIREEHSLDQAVTRFERIFMELAGNTD